MLTSSLFLALLPLAAADDSVSLASGQTFSTPPTHLGPLLKEPGKPSVEAMRAHILAGDLHAARWEAERITDANRWGRDRDIAWMVQGMLHREEGHHNLASMAFTKARSTRGPLSGWGAYYEAEQDLERGRYWVAARECATYRDKNPDGRHATTCHRVMALAYAKAGAFSKARAEAKTYDKEHPHAPIGEQIELTLTLGLLAKKPEATIPRLQQHALSFTAPLTAKVAIQELAKLREKGFENATVPNDIESRKRRALSLRQTKQTNEAWRMYADLVMDSDDDPALRSWVEATAETFGWRTRHWDFLADVYADKYRETPKPEYAWKRFRVLSRGGRFEEARLVSKAALKAHGTSKVWRHKEEAVAQTMMFAKDYKGAQRQYDRLRKKGGWTARRARFYAAFCGVMGGFDDKTTKQRLDAVIALNGSYAHEARYWRAQLFDRLGDAQAASADREALLAEQPDSWYSAQTRAKLTANDPMLDRRHGLWAGEPWAERPVVEGELPLQINQSFATAAPVIPASRPAAAGFGVLSWGEPSDLEAESDSPDYLLAHPDRPPHSYLATAFFDPSSARSFFRTWSEANRTAWPELKAAYELARGGLYDLSGPVLSQVYEDWKSAYRNRTDPKHAAARRMQVDSASWRRLFGFARDHHHTSRFNHGMWKNVEDPEQAKLAKQLAYPLAHDRYVWSHSREHGVDPYLILGLMRQESTYNSIARSPVGARGAMQIMPKTGHLLAHITEDLNYDAGDLEDPVFAVGHGIRYMGLLLDRFDGVYPLAVASYNGGPFNVSSWMKGAGPDMPVDAFVEHIPYTETRDYVKRVSGHYSAYLSLYAPEGTLLAPPTELRGDDSSVVNF